jgi:hypothetical protein
MKVLTIGLFSKNKYFLNISYFFDMLDVHIACKSQSFRLQVQLVADCTVVEEAQNWRLPRYNESGKEGLETS